MEKQLFYLGVEGGGTKSTAFLADDKRILHKQEGLRLNYHAIGERAARKNIAALLKPLPAKSNTKQVYAVFGFAGLDTKKDELAYRRIVRTVLPPNAVFRVVNDAEIALEAKCPNEENRVLVITGTGSTVYGQSGARSAKTIGWDFVLGDEGSGYEVGLKVLKAATQSWDDRAPKTILEQLVLRKASVNSMDDFIPKFYQVINDQKQDPKSYIASFAPLIDKAIAKGDASALEIREQTMRSLLLGTTTVANKLGFGQRRFCVGFVGSLWKMPGLKDGFQKQLKQQFSGASFSEQKNSPAWGAVLLAKKLAEK